MMPRGGFDIDSISVRQNSGEIQYQYSGGDWKKIISLDELRGKDGRSIEVQKGSLYIQWRYTGDSEWKNVIAYSDLLKGQNGQDGKDGKDGKDGRNGINGQNGKDGTGATGAAGRNATISATNSTQPCSTGLTITGNGTSNLGLQFTGKNLPAGGKTNQVLGKKTDNDCDVEWKDTYEIRGTGMPEGNVKASVGTYYTDTAATNGAIRWIKTSGSDKLGWKVVYGDTGWRSVPQILSTSMKASVVKVRRINNTVYLYAALTGWGYSWNGGGAPLPSGLRPGDQMQGPSAGRYGNSYLTWIIQTTGQIQAEAASAQNPTPTLPPIVSVSYIPDDNVPWPTTLPGTAM